MKKYFKSKQNNIPLPVFFPDATRAVLRTLDSVDIGKTQTPGILVNTYHLYNEVGKRILKKHEGVGNFMNWKGGIISDSGGFQVMSLVKSGNAGGKVTDEGVHFKLSKNKKAVFTPEKSIEFQMSIMPDMCVVLDDFTAPTDTFEQAKVTVDRTIAWAIRSKKEFEKHIRAKKLTEETRPYLLAVVQGGPYQDLRAYCAQELAKIGFDGFGYGGWPIDLEGNFDYESARTIADNTPDGYFLYGLGIGKPEEIVALTEMGYTIFDCVLPTRDARHGRLYVYTADEISDINVYEPNFYEYYVPHKQKHAADTRPVSNACDCLLCTRYTRSYLAHLFRIKDVTAMRLATIHNLRFYSLLMEKLGKKNA